MGFTLQRNAGAQASLTEWGIDLASATLTLRSFSADEFSFNIPVPDAFVPAKFAYGDKVTLRKDGVVIFIGKIRRRPRFGSQEAERLRYVAYNFWHDLEMLPYEQFRGIVQEDFETLDLVASTQVVLCLNVSTGAKISNEAEMLNLLSFATLAGVPVNSDFDFTEMTPMWQQCTDIMVASALRQMASWQPDLMGRCSYSTGVPTLRLRRPGTADTTNIDLTAETLLKNVEADVRDDIKVNGVVFNFITEETNTADGKTYARLTAQQGGPANAGTGVIKSTIPMASSEDIPLTAATEYYNALGTAFLEGRINTKGREISLDCKVGDLLSFTHGPAEWSGTRICVQEIQHLLGTGESVVQFGPPSFIIPNFAELNRRAKDARQPQPVPPPDAGDPAVNPDAPGNILTGLTPKVGPTSGGSQQMPVCTGGVQSMVTVKLA